MERNYYPALDALVLAILKLAILICSRREIFICFLWKIFIKLSLVIRHKINYSKKKYEEQ